MGFALKIVERAFLQWKDLKVKQLSGCPFKIEQLCFLLRISRKDFSRIGF